MEPPGTRRLRHRNEAGRLPHHRDPLQTQAHVEDMVKNSTELSGTGFEHPGTDTIRTRSLARVEFPRLSPNIFSCDVHCGGGGMLNDCRAAEEGCEWPSLKDERL